MSFAVAIFPSSAHAPRTADFEATVNLIHKIDSTGTTVIAVLPPALGLGGQWIGFVNAGSGATMQPDGTDTIDSGAAGAPAPIYNGFVTICISDGISRWMTAVN